MRSKGQDIVCEWIGVTSDKPDEDSLTRFAMESIGRGILQGLRRPSNEKSNGWYIWFGDYSEANDFFSPISVKDLGDYLNSNVIDYLDLPTGYRFLIDGDNYENVWFDKELLGAT